jgi:hypothetical protein
MNTARLLGRGTAGVGAVEEIVIGSGLTLTGTTLSAAGGSGITIGTTAIASGTVGRVLFEGAGNVVQQSSNFFWDNTNGRLGVRVATPTASLEVLGAAPSGTTQSFAVHNSTGTNNALVVRDDGRVGISTNAPVSALNVVNTGGTSVGTLVTLDGLATVPLTNFHNNRIDFRNVANTVFGRIFTYSGGQFNGLWLDAGANTSQLILRQGGGVIASSGTGDFSSNASLQTVSSAGVLNVYNTTPINTASIRLYANTNNITIPLLLFQSYANSSTNVLRRVCSVKNINTVLTNGSESTDFVVDLISNGAETERFRLKSSGNLLLGTTSEGASATKTLVINNGTAPTGDVTDSFQQYSADIVAGNAAPHFRTENGNVIKIYQETTGIAAAAFVANTSLIVDDSATFGGYTIGQVVAALKAQGLLA